MFLKRVFPYVLAAIAVCTAFFLISCGSDPPKTMKVEKTVKANEIQAGIVYFPHDPHSKAGVQCVECHHKKGNPEREKKCAIDGCHQGESGLKTMHELCVGCHLSVKKGPRPCNECHTPLKKE